MMISPCPKLAGEYEIALQVTNVGGSALSLPLVGGTTAPGAVPLPITVKGLHIVSDRWRLIPALDASADGSERPLAFLESRTLHYRLLPRVSHPTLALLPDGGTVSIDVSSLALSNAGKGGSSHVDLPAALLTLLRQFNSVSTIHSTIRSDRAKEHARRRAAEAADALPPTLRSIREARAGAGGADDGSLLEPLMPPLPAELSALASRRTHVTLVLEWERHADLTAAMSGGTVASSLCTGSQFFLALPVEGSGFRSSAGSVPNWLPSDIAKSLTQAFVPAAAAAPAPSTAAVPRAGPAPAAAALRPPNAPSSANPFGPSQPGAARTAAAPGGPAVANAATGTVAKKKGGAAQARRIIVASLEHPHDVAFSAELHPQVPIALLLYHAGNDADGAVNITLQIGASAADAATEVDQLPQGHPGEALRWVGSPTLALPPLAPGTRLMLTLMAVPTRVGAVDLSQHVRMRIVPVAAAAKGQGTGCSSAFEPALIKPHILNIGAARVTQ
jgi:hypothetical protein